MKTLIVLAHPDQKSFNHAIAAEARRVLERNGHEVVFHDLYKIQFDPVLPSAEIPKNGNLDPALQQSCDAAASADGIIIVHPNWWGQPPAILKGWIDRVLRPGVAYEFLEGDAGEGIPRGLLKAKTALVFNTSNTAEQRERNVFGDPLASIWRNCIFDLCGVRDFHRRMFSIVVTSSESQRRSWLAEVRETVDRYFPAE
jgi:NAD(P)H dehydrogenase (quinone)